jgi:hypothetical protein
MPPTVLLIVTSLTVLATFHHTTVSARFVNGVNVDVVPETDYEEYIATASRKGSHIFGMFYTHHCKTAKCIKFTPTWLHLYDVYNHYNGHDISLQAFDCSSTGREVCDQYNTFSAGRPTIRHIYNGTSSLYTGAMKWANFERWMQNRLPAFIKGTKSIEPRDHCIAFRRTSQCDGSLGSSRQPLKDISCIDTVRSGAEGYCECMNGGNENNGSFFPKMVSCGHKPFRCYDYCATSLVCEKWSQTRRCDPAAERDEENDASCFSLIHRGNSGNCLCTNGEKKPFTCDHETITCEEVCEATISGDPPTEDDENVDQGNTEL